MKIGIENDNWTAKYYEATVVSVVDYYPFGSAMAGRKYNQGSYRYGFNGMEKDDEVKGEGNSYDFGARIFDSRVGRWLAVDPLAAEYSNLSTYVFVANSPLKFIDPDGKKIKIVGEEGQALFMKDLKSVFGKKEAKNYSFDDNGFLIYKGDPNIIPKKYKKLNKEYNYVTKGLLSVIDEDRVTNIVYLNAGETVTLKNKNTGKLEILDPNTRGGEATATAHDSNGAIDENTITLIKDKTQKYFVRVEKVTYYYVWEIKVDPTTETPVLDANGNQRKIETTTTRPGHPDPILDKSGNPKTLERLEAVTAKVERYLNLFHAIGHIIHDDNNEQGYVLDYDNAIRILTKKDKRPDDEGHHDRSGKDKLKTEKTDDEK